MWFLRMYDGVRYDSAIRNGILDALSELGHEKPIGSFLLEEAGFSTNIEANVPFAYREAAKQAVTEVFKGLQE
jgi:hypothetical protein